MDWKQLMAYMTSLVAQELLVRYDYLVTEKRMLRQESTGRVPLGDGERKTLAELRKKLGRLSRWSRSSWWRQRGFLSQGA